MQRLKRVFDIDIKLCEKCKGSVKIAAPAHLTVKDDGNAGFAGAKTCHALATFVHPCTADGGGANCGLKFQTSQKRLIKGRMNRWIGQYRGVLVRLPRLSGAGRMIFPGNEGVDLYRGSFYSSFKHGNK